MSIEALDKVDKVQINFWIPRAFLQLIDEAARLTGSTRSDLLRRAIEAYLLELKKSSMLQDLRGRTEMKRGQRMI